MAVDNIQTRKYYYCETFRQLPQPELFFTVGGGGWTSPWNCSLVNYDDFQSNLIKNIKFEFSSAPKGSNKIRFFHNEDSEQIYIGIFVDSTPISCNKITMEFIDQVQFWFEDDVDYQSGSKRVVKGPTYQIKLPTGIIYNKPPQALCIYHDYTASTHASTKTYDTFIFPVFKYNNVYYYNNGASISKQIKNIEGESFDFSLIQFKNSCYRPNSENLIDSLSVGSGSQTSTYTHYKTNSQIITFPGYTGNKTEDWTYFKDQDKGYKNFTALPPSREWDFWRVTDNPSGLTTSDTQEYMYLFYKPIFTFQKDKQVFTSSYNNGNPGTWTLNWSLEFDCKNNYKLGYNWTNAQTFNYQGRIDVGCQTWNGSINKLISRKPDKTTFNSTLQIKVTNSTILCHDYITNNTATSWDYPYLWSNQTKSDATWRQVNKNIQQRWSGGYPPIDIRNNFATSDYCSEYGWIVTGGADTGHQLFLSNSGRTWIEQASFLYNVGMINYDMNLDDFNYTLPENGNSSSYYYPFIKQQHNEPKKFMQNITTSEHNLQLLLKDAEENPQIYANDLIGSSDVWSWCIKSDTYWLNAHFFGIHFSSSNYTFYRKIWLKNQNKKLRFLKKTGSGILVYVNGDAVYDLDNGQYIGAYTSNTSFHQNDVISFESTNNNSVYINDVEYNDVNKIHYIITNNDPSEITIRLAQSDTRTITIRIAGTYSGSTDLYVNNVFQTTIGNSSAGIVWASRGMSAGDISCELIRHGGQLLRWPDDSTTTYTIPAGDSTTIILTIS